ncbi:MAG: nitroreductase family protein [Candidatus Sumerlaeia bacterium]|nr:nitroreductase family protein [Candidatus Sumerlaeia bacterium]
MKRSRFYLVGFLAMTVLLAAAIASAQTTSTIALPTPQTEGGKPLMQALKERKTIRALSDKAIPLQTLSNLLWAAAGINRPDSGKRTAPSATDAQEIEVYVAQRDGVYLYEGKAHALRKISSEDIRGKLGGGEFSKKAPMSLIYVADQAKMKKVKDPKKKDFYSAADTGFISQNVYLFCASEGLGTVVHDGANRPEIAKALGLRPDQKIMLGQAIGYPE